ncbi:MAG: hypothetical protein GY815_17910, partial [Gammaproteobacteria bacterium]|nr:hypothetical protein [Gammaproteobacteria bacterium]
MVAGTIRARLCRATQAFHAFRVNNPIQNWCRLAQGAVALMLLTISFQGVADTFLVLPPYAVERSSGKPVADIRNFSVADINGRFTLNIYHGGRGGHKRKGPRVRFSKILLNGKKIFGPRKFDHRVGSLSKEVVLQTDNELSVTLKGIPGGVIVLEIVGEGTSEADNDGDGIPDSVDPDDDNDGVLDVDDAFPLDSTESVDTDSDGIGNNADTDDDNDGVLDADDAFPLDSTESVDTDSDGIGNNADPDDDNDGVLDAADAFPLDSTESADTDGDGIGNNADPDDDNDGVLDADDAFPLDSTESVDTDSDGIGNNADPDDDNDGVLDAADAFPLDSTESVDTDSDGIGNNADTDDDNDGVLDADDAFPLDSSESVDTDNDGIGDNADPDRDGDGVDNTQDAFPNDPTESSDLDGDGIGDNADLDRDGDGVSNDLETQAGSDPNDPDSTPPDQDGDGLPDSLDADRDGDGVDNDVDSFPDDPTETHDFDGDGIGNNADTDRDGDGVDNASDAFPDDNTEAYDLDNDGIGDNADTDRDGDGILNDDDYFPDDPQAFSVPTVNITSPDTLVTLGASPVTIEGTISDPDAILTVNGTPVSHANGTFTAAVGLEEGSNTIIVRAVDTLNHEGTATITVSLDQTAPYITIESHQDGDTVYQDSITVSGLVNDIVRGTVSENEAQVTVNGVTASVANRSYLAEGIALGVGENTITIVASDAVGNVGSESITLTYAAPQNNIISAIAGQAQSGATRSQLADPLAVRLVSNGSPAVNQTVVFRVIQGDGIFPSVSDSANSAVIVTDSNGEASIDFQLGSRSGNGNNQIRATAVGYEGQALFYASANAGAATRIGVIDGYNQRGAVRQPLPDPLTVAVTDGGANLISNAEVIFTVTEGSGRFSNGEATVTVFTDTDGRASARYTLGPEQGLDVQRVIASLVNTAATAGFTASAFMPGDSGQTSISGVVVDNQDQPLDNVTVRIEGSTRQAVSDAAGQFIITEAPVGPVHLLVDGSTTSRDGEWPSLSYNLVTVPGVENPLPGPVYLVELDAANAVAVGAQDAVVTHPDLPGFALEVAAGSVTFPDGSKTGSLSITTVNANKVPMPPPNGVQPQLIVTIQPHGAAFDPPAPITVPNTDGLAPLSEIEMFSYDHDLEEFVTIGLGAVSKDGLTIASKTGSGVVKAGWFAAPTPPDDDGPVGPGPEPDDNPDPDPDEEEEKDDLCKGCPVWSVTKKSLNLVVKDAPLWYNSPVGPNVSIRLVH